MTPNAQLHEMAPRSRSPSTGDEPGGLAVHVPEAAARYRAWLPRVGFGLAAVFFALLVPAGFVRAWALDAPPLGWAQWASAFVVAVSTMLVLPRRTRPRRVAAAGVGAALAVLAVSAAMLVVVPAAPGEWQPTVLTPPERYGLGLLALLATRRCRAAPAVAAVAATGLAAGTAGPLRLSSLSETSVTAAYTSLLLMVAAVSIGLFLRVAAAARDQQLTQARRAERLALARDVHDTVAHHMTGIIVQAQASRHVAERDPTAAAYALERIEQASLEALTAMRRVVAALREDDTPAPREPTELRTDLHRLADATGHPPVRVTLHDDTDTSVPPEVSSTVLRIARESLTNVRRHAHASHIDVETRLENEHVTIDITDDGRASPPAGDGGGYGLAGLAERVHTLGGDFTAGPREGGWCVHARLPLHQEPL